MTRPADVLVIVVAAVVVAGACSRDAGDEPVAERVVLARLAFDGERVDEAYVRGAERRADGLRCANPDARGDVEWSEPLGPFSTGEDAARGAIAETLDDDIWIGGDSFDVVFGDDRSRGYGRLWADDEITGLFPLEAGAEGVLSIGYRGCVPVSDRPPER